jgi:hypothetical protein
MSARRALALAALLAAATRASPALARNGDAAAAEVLFDEARRLLASGDVKAACPKFAESYRLDPALGALLNLAACHEKEGRLATAWSEYRDAEAQAVRARDEDRRKYAKKQAAAIEPRLPRLAVAITETPRGLAVTRNGEPMGEASFGLLLPVDPGPQELAATAPGRERWTKRLTLDEGARVRVVVPDLPVAKVDPAAARPPPLASAPAPAPVAPPPSLPRDSSSSGQRTTGFALGGAGLAALAVGGIFAGLTAAKKASADERCPDKLCDAAGLGDVATARTYAWVADITLGAGGALVIVGGILALTAGPASDPASTGALRVAPAVGSRSGGLVVGGSF